MEILAALNQRLHQAIAANGDRDAPVTVGDVYQRLIPYRSVRDELGILEFAAYEHGLLRLLSGEGGHLAVLDPQALEEIQRELASTNPILGIYRDYSDATVEVEDGVTTYPAVVIGPAAPSDSPVTEDTPPPAEAAPDSAAEPGPRPPFADPDHSAAVTATPPICRGCHETLPQIEPLLYCPFCGESQGPQPCAECGTPLERAWSYCIRCGAARAAS